MLSTTYNSECTVYNLCLPSMPAYVVGRDWPDALYATNASWPQPCQWGWRTKERQAGFYASLTEAKRAKEIEEQRQARIASGRLKKQLFAAIVQVRAQANCRASTYCGILELRLTNRCRRNVLRIAYTT